MNQVFTMINESNKRMKMIMDKEVIYERDRLFDSQREFESQIALVDVVGHAYGIPSKNKRARVNIENNEIDDTIGIIFESKQLDGGE